MIASVTARLEGGLSVPTPCGEDSKPDEASGRNLRKLKTTVKDPMSIERDKLNYLYGYYGSEKHIPGICPCEVCVTKQEELMAWALQTAHEQHAQAVAAAVAASDEAQKTGTGPKPMMVTPYKHNWVIAGSDKKEEIETKKEYGPASCLVSRFLGSLIGTGFFKTCTNYVRSDARAIMRLVAGSPTHDRTA